ncbi:AhpC/TSA family protein [Amniculicola lignicola CBS 123094]|uniref:AhpC/TSA family protein n=1 Tax=Amniculicola lignicola CBS 123094 TaxID=1392246 RepID=A0A6A5WHX1_9PLEO|nr:AhpC/TSA family protein [Amniculicola lignicola CBS 123094]
MFFAARRLTGAFPLALHRLAAAPFHSTAPALVKVGDRIPEHVKLMEGSPGNLVSLAQELKGKTGLIIGVPAAYSPACSETHIPGYINSTRLKDAGAVFVVAANDAFVMKAWSKALDPSGSSGIRFLADPTLAFTNALDLSFDGSAIFGGHRGKRYALIVKDGVVEEAYVEPDNTGLNVSAAEKVLG